MKLKKIAYLIWVNHYFINIYFFKIVLGIAANKNDLYEKVEVEDNEGEMLAKDLGAIFQRTIMDSSLRDKENIVEEVERKRKNSVKINKDNNNKNAQKKGCC